MKAQISKYYQSELNTAKYKAQKKLIPQKIFCSIEGCTSTFSSTWTYKRHLVEIHSFVETKLAEKIEAEGLLAETFSGRITCPVLGCRAGFSLVQSFRDHLDNHGMVKQKIAEAVEKHQDQSITNSNQTELSIIFFPGLYSNTYWTPPLQRRNVIDI